MHEERLRVLAPALEQLAALALDPHITRVASRTDTSQPTLTRAVREWERVLGVPILTRVGRRVELTDDGRMLASAAAESLGVLEKALSRILGTTDEGVLTVGFLHSLGPTVAGELIASFLPTRPGTVIAHREGSSADLADGLDEGRMDVVITAPRPPARFGWLPLGRQALLVVMPTGHPLAGAERIALGDIRDEPFLALDRRFDSRQRADALCAAAGFVPRVVLEADNLLTVRGYVSAGLGVAILPADATPSPRTQAVPIDSDESSRTFGLAWDRTRTSVAGEALRQHAQSLNARYPGWADVTA